MGEVFCAFAEVVVDGAACGDVFDAREEEWGERGVRSKSGAKDANVERREVEVREGLVEKVWLRRRVRC